MNSPGSGMVVVVVVVVVGGRVVVVVVVVVVGGGRVVVVVVVLEVVVVLGGTVVVVELVVVGGEIEVGGLSVVEVVDGLVATTRPGVAAFQISVGVVTGAVVVPAGEAPACFPAAVIELEDAGIKVAGAIGGKVAVEMTSPCDDATPSAESGIAHVRPIIRPTTGTSRTMARNAIAFIRSG